MRAEQVFDFFEEVLGGFDSAGVADEFGGRVEWAVMVGAALSGAGSFRFAARLLFDAFRLLHFRFDGVYETRLDLDAVFLAMRDNLTGLRDAGVNRLAHRRRL